MDMEEFDKSMYYGAKPETLEAARILRENMTLYEKLLWDRLKQKQVCGLRFRRQHPIDFFIADFYYHEARLSWRLMVRFTKTKKNMMMVVVQKWRDFV